MLTLPASTVEYIHVDITGAPGDITSRPVDVALIPAGEAPTEDTWQPAGWAPDQAATIRWLATGLTPGRFALWVRITDTPETPVRWTGGVYVT